MRNCKNTHTLDMLVKYRTQSHPPLSQRVSRRDDGGQYGPRREERLSGELRGPLRTAGSPALH